ncbi:uncharacterized protein LOC125031406 [Penaeus chinensis]|uniref:uncharacterized protein LOC125031406 n=1 Tax=Penaeus chinensis TaxID=139456 RepID=UPI001FB59C13|nr:uncharacterized protein LOC125031406 [Penaeus chinensis]
MFGCEARVGLTSSPLPTEVITRLENEDDLIASMSGDDATTTIGSAASSTGSVTTSEATTSANNDFRLDFQVSGPGNNVAVPIPAVDRGRGDPRNILGVIVSRDLDNDQHKIAVKSGVLKGQYSRNQFDLCPERLLTDDDVNQDTAVSLREAVIAQSACGGQRLIRCNCSGLKICSTDASFSKLK